MRTLRTILHGIGVGFLIAALVLGLLLVYLSFFRQDIVLSTVTTEPATTTTTEPASTTTTVATTTTTTAAGSWYDEPRCDGKPCGPNADSPTDVIACDSHDGATYVAGRKQVGGTCPPAEESDAFACPPDEWRRGDVRVDYAARADGCGPLVGDWL